MNSINERFQAVIRRNTSETRRWSELEAFTGIPASSWQKAFHGKQRPTADMLQAVARQWPSLAFWLVTGVTDAKHGHVSCCGDRSGSFYPERPTAARLNAQPYFLQLIEIFEHCYGHRPPYQGPALEKEALVKLARLELARDSEELSLREASAESAMDALRDARLALEAAHKLEDALAMKQLITDKLESK